jgi:hypothetical protein
MVGRIEAYSPICTGSPAIRAKAMDAGMATTATVRPAVMSFLRNDVW